MSTPAVVILTDPAQCQLAEAETLVQALLQVQQLNKAGVPASQAFCDHPAAAMEFIDAYSKAYPALQLQTSDLPLPQQLYSMVADGRLSPLRPAEAVETAKPEQPGQLYPLYVLSLGAPEALIQALQHNNLAKSSIRVLEIAPIEQSSAEPVSVAEAVAAAPLARSSWLPESSRAPERGDEDAPGTESLAESQIELSGVEDDLDGIRIENSRDRQSHDRNDQVHYAPAVMTTLVGPDPSASSVSRQTTTEAPTSSSGISDPASQPAGPVTPPPEPVSDTHLALTTELSGTSTARAEVSPVGDEPPPDDGDEPPPDDGAGTPHGDGADTPDEPAPNDVGASEPPAGERDEQDLIADGDGHAPAEEEPDAEDAAPARRSGGERDGEDAPAGGSCTCADPAEDVLYQPNGSFSGNDDLAYALPTDDAGAPSLFASLFDFAEGAEVVDLEAMYRDLWESADGRAALEGFDCILMRAPNSARADPNDAPAAYSGCEGSVEQRTPEPDEDEAATNPLTTVHDADV
jgi:hypothetical protein